MKLRLRPGQDLRAVLDAVLAEHGDGASAGFVLQGIGSLGVAQLRLAGAFLRNHVFSREPDRAGSGYRELVVRPRS